MSRFGGQALQEIPVVLIVFSDPVKPVSAQIQGR
jgi:hypothetical protein